MATIQIKDLKQLKTLAKDGLEVSIVLNGGLRSSKYIVWDSHVRKFFITNYIDGSDESLTEKQLMDEEYTNIGKALLKGALITA